MSGLLGKALSALLTDGTGCRSIVEAIGRAAFASAPGSLTSVRQVYSPAEPEAYKWEITFLHRQEALQFDEAVRAACDFIIQEGE